MIDDKQEAQGSIDALLERQKMGAIYGTAFMLVAAGVAGLNYYHESVLSSIGLGFVGIGVLCILFIGGLVHMKAGADLVKLRGTVATLKEIKKSTEREDRNLGFKGLMLNATLGLMRIDLEAGQKVNDIAYKSSNSVVSNIHRILTIAFAILAWGAGWYFLSIVAGILFLSSLTIATCCYKTRTICTVGLSIVGELEEFVKENMPDAPDMSNFSGFGEAFLRATGVKFPDLTKPDPEDVNEDGSVG